MNLTTEQIALVISLIAIVFTFATFWYNSLRKGSLTFYCSRWTAIGMSVDGKEGAAFAINVGLNNTGNTPVEIKDFLLLAESNNKKIYYDPIILFDLTFYISSLGQDRRMANSQKGQVPLPIIIPSNEQYSFEKEILFMPLDKKTAILCKEDPPFTLKLYALTNRHSNYKLICEQSFSKEDIQNLINGSFAGVQSTYSIKNRTDFINRIN